ncbi:MAG TPA: aminoacyl-tRNA hydrolase [bacterium]|nr:aminoacyl-tRNA hydrolase [bacterium]
MKLIVGLGNPGRRYRGTRHNVGWEVIARLAERAGIRVNEDEGFAEVGRGTIGSRRVLLARPFTYMNVSGEAVRDLRRRHRLRPEDILVLVDDIDLPLGRLRLRAAGSAGWHNGLKSVIEALGTTEFPRLRVGIGSPPLGIDPADFVLTRFTAEEERMVHESLERAAEAVELAVTEGLPAAMNRFNARGVDGEP